MKNIKAIIFDMDGTIIDTEGIWKKATRHLIEKRGIQYTPELEREIDKYVRGSGLKEGCKLVKNIVKLDDNLEDLMAEKEKHANQLYREGVKFIDGFLEFHKKAVALNLDTAIATNADPTTVAVTDEVLNLRKIFGKHIYDISYVNFVPKPHPDLYLYVADIFKHKPSECLVIEDSAHGVAAAKSAGMTCIGINTSKNPKQLEKCDLIIDEYHEFDFNKLKKNI